MSTMLRVLALYICFGLTPAQRPLHWVIRVSDLRATLRFAQEVMGMKVLRHEEHDSACPITCNGRFDTPWSKTMVGYAPEDTSYTLELTYNYGVSHYERGTGLQSFALRVPHVDAALRRAKALGYAGACRDAGRAPGALCNGPALITGPDGYKYELHSGFEGRVEPFLDVVLKARDPAALGRWYTDVLGMRSSGLGEAVSYPPGSVVVISPAAALGKPHVPVRFVFEPAAETEPAPRITQWEGRSALALPEARVRAVNARLLFESPGLIVHGLLELQEHLGLLVLVIIRDPEGYELCLVSEETFDPSVRAATDYKGPDWGYRDQMVAERQEKTRPAEEL